MCTRRVHVLPHVESDCIQCHYYPAKLDVTASGLGPCFRAAYLAVTVCAPVMLTQHCVTLFYHRVALFLLASAHESHEPSCDWLDTLIPPDEGVSGGHDRVLVSHSPPLFLRLLWIT